MTQPSPIQRYLEDLRDRLAAVPDCDRILTEAEDHLVDAAAELQQTGLPATEAERSATLRFGEPQAVAERFIRQFKQGEMMYPKQPPPERRWVWLRLKVGLRLKPPEEVPAQSRLKAWWAR